MVMHILNIFFLLIAYFCVVNAEEFPNYKIIDLGLFETDSSNALSINEKGQILGTFRENNHSYVFLWEEKTGIKIIDPFENHIFSGNLLLNNQGQLTGMMQALDSKIKKIFYWDLCCGYWEIESLGVLNEDGESVTCSLLDFNDKGQILGILNGQIILWDHGKKIDLSALFCKQISGQWTSFLNPCLNNLGHIAFTVFDQKIKQYRAFFWDGSFKPIVLNGKEIHESTGNRIQTIKFLDDECNIIINLTTPNYQGTTYYLRQADDFFVPCNGCKCIKNSFPLSIDCLPSKLKQDRHGNFYFLQGIEIEKILRTINRIPEIYINDQNSEGHVVGSMDTLYGWHAFLAIPEQED